MKFEKGDGSQNGKPTCVTCGKRHYGECLRGTGSCFGCDKEGHKVSDCPTRDGKKVSPNVPKTKARFYAHWARVSKLDDD